MKPRDLIAIDPGVAGEGCACALFERGFVVEVWFAHPADRVGPRSRGLDAVIVERPQFDARARAVHAGTLIALAWEGALLAGRYAGIADCVVEAVEPRAWKGSVPKPVHHARLWVALDAAERASLGGNDTAQRIRAAQEKGAAERWRRPGGVYYPRAWTRHNILDAVALGAWACGRVA